MTLRNVLFRRHLRHESQRYVIWQGDRTTELAKTIDAELEKALEEAGWRSGDATDFLGMNDAEKQEFELHYFLCNAVHELREKLGLSQKQLAARLKVSKRTVDRMENGGGEITLEQLVHAYAAMGGRLAITELPPHSGNGTVKKKGKAQAKG